VGKKKLGVRCGREKINGQEGPEEKKSAGKKTNKNPKEGKGEKEKKKY
jgi:hypothetical protein